MMMMMMVMMMMMTMMSSSIAHVSIPNDAWCAQGELIKELNEQERDRCSTEAGETNKTKQNRYGAQMLQAIRQISLNNRPDITVIVDWALKINYLSIVS